MIRVCLQHVDTGQLLAQTTCDVRRRRLELQLSPGSEILMPDGPNFAKVPIDRQTRIVIDMIPDEAQLILPPPS